MRMAFYIDTLQLGGAERVMANLCNWFAEMGNEVLLINDIKSPDNIREHSLNKSVKRVYIATNQNKWFLKYNISRLKELRQCIKSFSPDVTISFLGPPNIRMLLATVGLHTKKIVSVRNDPYKEYGENIRKLFANIVFLLADGCVFQTKEARNYFVKSIQSKSKIIFNPVNKEFYEFTDGQFEKKEILMIGRLQEQKNPQMLIHAFNYVKDKYKDYRIVFLGTGELEKDIEELANRYGIRDNVEFRGQVSNVAECLASASLYVLSSNFEGMPNALMEAMAIGVPIISTNCPCGGPRVLIENEDQGILIKCGDINALANAMDKILSSSELRSKMRTESSKRAKAFHPNEIFRQWEEYIR